MGRARQLVATNYGREPGWLIELDGAVVGELVNPRFADMFWYEYDVEARGVIGHDALADDRNWQECRFAYRSMAMGEVARNAFGCPLRDGKVQMRGLYLLPHGRLEHFMVRVILAASPAMRQLRKRARGRAVR